MGYYLKMPLHSPLIVIILILTIMLDSGALAAGGCYDGIRHCDSYGPSFGAKSQSTTTGGKIKINPAAVPTEDAFGLESITFKTQTDLGFVRGNGRIGAAISPTNSEESFFGPPGFYDPSEFLQHKLDKEKYPSQKTTLATAFNVAQKNGSTFSSYTLRFGVMGRYNRFTHAITPGMGLSGSAGPLSFGVSAYDDQTQMDPDDADNDGLKPLYIYQVRTYSLGLNLNSLVLDYSHLMLNTQEIATVGLYTASLYVKKIIFTVSKRVENSSKQAFNFETQTLETKQIKEDMFGGIQYSVTNNFMLGALYNYYLLHEYSASATLFF